jgi:hypothetical protein
MSPRAANLKERGHLYNQWRAFVKTVMNIWVSLAANNLLTKLMIIRQEDFASCS